MKKLLFMLMMLPVAVMAQKINEGKFINFEKPGDAININSYKVSRSMDKGFAIARGLSDKEYDSYYGLTVLLKQEGKYFYDDEIVNVPTGMEARIVGIYKFQEEYKTVPVIQFYEKTTPVITDEAETIENNKSYDVVEQMPSYPGGNGALMQYLSSHIKYPVIAEENGIQGRVICTFVVERDGSITDVRIAKSVDPSLDKEAVRVVSSMPKWIPGKQDGKPVRVEYTFPVTFRLQ